MALVSPKISLGGLAEAADFRTQLNKRALDVLSSLQSDLNSFLGELFHVSNLECADAEDKQYSIGTVINGAIVPMPQNDTLAVSAGMQPGGSMSSALHAATVASTQLTRATISSFDELQAGVEALLLSLIEAVGAMPSAVADSDSPSVWSSRQLGFADDEAAGRNNVMREAAAAEAAAQRLQVEAQGARTKANALQASAWQKAAEAADLAAAATAAEVEAELNQLQERLPQALEAIQRARRLREASDTAMQESERLHSEYSAHMAESMEATRNATAALQSATKLEMRAVCMEADAANKASIKWQTTYSNTLDRAETAHTRATALAAEAAGIESEAARLHELSQQAYARGDYEQAHMLREQAMGLAHRAASIEAQAQTARSQALQLTDEAEQLLPQAEAAATHAAKMADARQHAEVLASQRKVERLMVQAEAEEAAARAAEEQASALRILADELHGKELAALDDVPGLERERRHEEVDVLKAAANKWAMLRHMVIKSANAAGAEALSHTLAAQSFRHAAAAAQRGEEGAEEAGAKALADMSNPIKQKEAARTALQELVHVMGLPSGIGLASEGFNEYQAAAASEEAREKAVRLSQQLTAAAAQLPSDPSLEPKQAEAMLDSAAVAHLVQTVKLAQIAKSWQARAEDAEQQMKASMEKVSLLESKSQQLEDEAMQLEEQALSQEQMGGQQEAASLLARAHTLHQQADGLRLSADAEKKTAAAREAESLHASHQSENLLRHSTLLDDAARKFQDALLRASVASSLNRPSTPGDAKAQHSVGEADVSLHETVEGRDVADATLRYGQSTPDSEPQSRSLQLDSLTLDSSALTLPQMLEGGSSWFGQSQPSPLPSPKPSAAPPAITTAASDELALETSFSDTLSSPTPPSQPQVPPPPENNEDIVSTATRLLASLQKTSLWSSSTLQKQNDHPGWDDSQLLAGHCDENRPAGDEVAVFSGATAEQSAHDSLSQHELPAAVPPTVWDTAAILDQLPTRGLRLSSLLPGIDDQSSPGVGGQGYFGVGDQSSSDLDGLGFSFVSGQKEAQYSSNVPSHQEESQHMDFMPADDGGWRAGADYSRINDLISATSDALGHLEADVIRQQQDMQRLDQQAQGTQTHMQSLSSSPDVSQGELTVAQLRADHSELLRDAKAHELQSSREQVGKLGERLDKLHAALSHLCNSYMHGKAQQAAKAYEASSTAQINAWLSEARAIEEQAEATKSQAAAADTLSKRLVSSGRMTDGARMSSIRQSLQDEVPALLKQAALLRGVAERASQELKAVRRQQQAYKRRAKMHRELCNFMEQAADAEGHTAQLMFLHGQLLILAAELQADAVLKRTELDGVDSSGLVRRIIQQLEGRSATLMASSERLWQLVLDSANEPRVLSSICNLMGQAASLMQQLPVEHDEASDDDLAWCENAPIKQQVKMLEDTVLLLQRAAQAQVASRQLRQELAEAEVLESGLDQDGVDPAKLQESAARRQKIKRMQARLELQSTASASFQHAAEYLQVCRNITTLIQALQAEVETAAQHVQGYRQRAEGSLAESAAMQAQADAAKARASLLLSQHQLAQARAAEDAYHHLLDVSRQHTVAATQATDQAADCEQNRAQQEASVQELQLVVDLSMQASQLMSKLAEAHLHGAQHGMDALTQQQVAQVRLYSRAARKLQAILTVVKQLVQERQDLLADGGTDVSSRHSQLRSSEASLQQHLDTWTEFSKALEFFDSAIKHQTDAAQCSNLVASLSNKADAARAQAAERQLELIHQQTVLAAVQNELARTADQTTVMGARARELSQAGQHENSRVLLKACGQLEQDLASAEARTAEARQRLEACEEAAANASQLAEAFQLQRLKLEETLQVLQQMAEANMAAAEAQLEAAESREEASTSRNSTLQSGTPQATNCGQSQADAKYMQAVLVAEAAAARVNSLREQSQHVSALQEGSGVSSAHRKHAECVLNLEMARQEAQELEELVQEAETLGREALHKLSAESQEDGPSLAAAAQYHRAMAQQYRDRLEDDVVPKLSQLQGQVQDAELAINTELEATRASLLQARTGEEVCKARQRLQQLEQQLPGAEAALASSPHSVAPEAQALLEQLRAAIAACRAEVKHAEGLAAYENAMAQIGVSEAFFTQLQSNASAEAEKCQQVAQELADEADKADMRARQSLAASEAALEAGRLPEAASAHASAIRMQERTETLRTSLQQARTLYAEAATLRQHAATSLHHIGEAHTLLRDAPDTVRQAAALASTIASHTTQLLQAQTHLTKLQASVQFGEPGALTMAALHTNKLRTASLGVHQGVEQAQSDLDGIGWAANILGSVAVNIAKGLEMRRLAVTQLRAQFDQGFNATERQNNVLALDSEAAAAARAATMLSELGHPEADYAATAAIRAQEAAAAAMNRSTPHLETEHACDQLLALSDKALHLATLHNQLFLLEQQQRQAEREALPAIHSQAEKQLQGVQRAAAHAERWQAEMKQASSDLEACQAALRDAPAHHAPVLKARLDTAQARLSAAAQNVVHADQLVKAAQAVRRLAELRLEQGKAHVEVHTQGCALLREVIAMQEAASGDKAGGEAPVFSTGSTQSCSSLISTGLRSNRGHDDAVVDDVCSHGTASEASSQRLMTALQMAMEVMTHDLCSRSDQEADEKLVELRGHALEALARYLRHSLDQHECGQYIARWTAALEEARHEAKQAGEAGGGVEAAEGACDDAVVVADQDDKLKAMAALISTLERRYSALGVAIKELLMQAKQAATAVAARQACDSGEDQADGTATDAGETQVQLRKCRNAVSELLGPWLAKLELAVTSRVGAVGAWVDAMHAWREGSESSSAWADSKSRPMSKNTVGIGMVSSRAYSDAKHRAAECSEKADQLEAEASALQEGFSLQLEVARLVQPRSQSQARLAAPATPVREVQATLDAVQGHLEAVNKALVSAVAREAEQAAADAVAEASAAASAAVASKVAAIEAAAEKAAQAAAKTASDEAVAVIKTAALAAVVAANEATSALEAAALEATLAAASNVAVQAALRESRGITAKDRATSDSIAGAFTAANSVAVDRTAADSIRPMHGGSAASVPATPTPAAQIPLPHLEPSQRPGEGPAGTHSMLHGAPPSTLHADEEEEERQMYSGRPGARRSTAELLGGVSGYYSHTQSDMPDFGMHGTPGPSHHTPYLGNMRSPESPPRSPHHALSPGPARTSPDEGRAVPRKPLPPHMTSQQALELLAEWSTRSSLARKAHHLAAQLAELASLQAADADAGALRAEVEARRGFSDGQPAVMSMATSSATSLRAHASQLRAQAASAAREALEMESEVATTAGMVERLRLHTSDYVPPSTELAIALAGTTKSDASLLPPTLTAGAAAAVAAVATSAAQQGSIRLPQTAPGSFAHPRHYQQHPTFTPHPVMASQHSRSQSPARRLLTDMFSLHKPPPSVTSTLGTTIGGVFVPGNVLQGLKWSLGGAAATPVLGTTTLTSAAGVGVDSMQAGADTGAASTLLGAAQAKSWLDLRRMLVHQALAPMQARVQRMLAEAAKKSQVADERARKEKEAQRRAAALEKHGVVVPGVQPNDAAVLRVQADRYARQSKEARARARELAAGAQLMGGYMTELEAAIRGLDGALSQLCMAANHELQGTKALREASELRCQALMLAVERMSDAEAAARLNSMLRDAVPGAAGSALFASGDNAGGNAGTGAETLLYAAADQRTQAGLKMMSLTIEAGQAAAAAFGRAVVAAVGQLQAVCQDLEQHAVGIMQQGSERASQANTSQESAARASRKASQAQTMGSATLALQYTQASEKWMKNNEAMLAEAKAMKEQSEALAANAADLRQLAGSIEGQAKAMSASLDSMLDANTIELLNRTKNLVINAPALPPPPAPRHLATSSTPASSITFGRPGRATATTAVLHDGGGVTLQPRAATSQHTTYTASPTRSRGPTASTEHGTGMRGAPLGRVTMLTAYNNSDRGDGGDGLAAGRLRELHKKLQKLEESVTHTRRVVAAASPPHRRPMTAATTRAVAVSRDVLDSRYTGAGKTRSVSPWKAELIATGATISDARRRMQADQDSGLQACKG